MENSLNIAPVRSTKGMKKPNLSIDERNAVVHFLLQRRKDDGKLKGGSLTETATHFSVSTKTVKRIWDRYLETTDSRGIGGDVSSRKWNSGRKKRNMDELNAIADIPLNKRSTLRSLSCSISLYRYITCA